MNKRNCFRVILILPFILYSVTTYAAVTGSVTDRQGNPVSGALVTFTNEMDSDISFSDYTDSMGRYEIALIPVSAENEIPVQFNLYQNFPNPFNPSTTISYSLARSGHVTLTVYNSMGTIYTDTYR